MSKADDYARRAVFLEELIAEAQAKVTDLQREARLNEEMIAQHLSLGEIADRGDGVVYFLDDSLADGKACVRTDAIDEHAGMLRQFDLAPVERTTTHYPGVGDFRKARKALAEAGLDYRDFIDEPPSKVGLRKRKIVEVADA